MVAAQIQTEFAIVDDGSHIPEHQLLTWDLFFRTVLEPGGVYIVEDIEVSCWRRGVLYGYPTRYGLHQSRTFMAVMKLVVDWLNRDFLSAEDRCVLANRLQDSGLSPATCEQVASIEFAQNCVVLRKREPWEQIYDGRPYRFADYI